MTLSLGQCLFDLPAKDREWSAFPFEKPKLIP
jgi:hypothetical protein